MDRHIKSVQKMCNVPDKPGQTMGREGRVECEREGEIEMLHFNAMFHFNAPF